MAANPVIAAKLGKLRLMLSKVATHEPAMSNQWRNAVAAELERSIRYLKDHVDVAEQCAALKAKD